MIYDLVILVLIGALGAVTHLMGRGYFSVWNVLVEDFVRVTPAVAFGVSVGWLAGLPEYGLVLTVFYAFGSLNHWSIYTRQAVLGEPRQDAGLIFIDWMVDLLDARSQYIPGPVLSRVKGALSLSLRGLEFTVMTTTPFVIFHDPLMVLAAPLGLLYGPLVLLGAAAGNPLGVAWDRIGIYTGSVFAGGFWMLLVFLA